MYGASYLHHNFFFKKVLYLLYLIRSTCFWFNLKCMIGNCSSSPYTFKINTLIKRVIFAYYWTGKVLGTRFVFASHMFQEALPGFLWLQLSAIKSSLSINQWAGKQVWLNVSKFFVFVLLFSLIHVVVVSCCFSTGCYSETKRQFLGVVGFLMLRLSTCLQSNLS